MVKSKLKYKTETYKWPNSWASILALQKLFFFFPTPTIPQDKFVPIDSSSRAIPSKYYKLNLWFTKCMF